MAKTYFKLVVAELLVIAVVIATFTTIKTKVIAGAVAGSFFVALGIWIFVRGVRDPVFRRSSSFVVGCIHLFVVALPMMITRLVNVSMPFEDIKILGLPGPIFHSLSTWVYLLLILAGLLDAFFSYRKARAPKA